ncbi:MAG: linear amide C-N hydrolase [Bacilli bacterium]
MNRKLKRGLIISVCAILGIVVAAGVTVTSIWYNEISTMMSFKKIQDRNDDEGDGAVYSMDVKGDFYFDDFLNKGASSDSELISFITSNITKGVIPMKISESEIACSAFTASTKDGDRIFARNYDFSTTNTCLTFTDPKSEGRHKSFSTIDLQFLGLDTDKDVIGLMNNITALAAPFVPLDGVNDAGVSCGIFMSYQGGETTVATNQNTDKIDITSTTMLRLILDYADTVEEAVELVSKYDLHDSASTSYHYMVADASWKSAILEWVNGTDATDNNGSDRELTVTYNDSDSLIGEKEAGASYQWITNFIIQPDYYETDAEKAGLNRYEKIYENLSLTDGVVEDEEQAMDILRQVGQRTINVSTHGRTVHSVVYNLTKKTVYWVSNENYGDESSTFRYTL